MKELVIDAGPLIAFFYAKDTEHLNSVMGFQKLQQANTKILIPMPILFEVYKWLLQKSTLTIAHNALDILLEEFVVISVNQKELLELQAFIHRLPTWKGSLEDATVIAIAFRYQCPVWTINYRDFGSFKALSFWTPN